MAKYLDDDGLLYFWQKIKNLFALKTDVPSASSTTPKANGTAAVGTEAAWAHGDHVHPTDTTRAPLASPALTGTPTAPTAAAGTNTTQIATTAFVKNAVDNVTISDFTGATASAAGAHGLVPAPASGDQKDMLFGDGTWKSVVLARTDHATTVDVKLSRVDGNTVVDQITSVSLAAATDDNAGLLSALKSQKLDGIESGANNYTHPAYDAASAAAVKVGRDATGHVVIGDALTASDVGASATGHKHAAGDVTSGTFAAARIPNLPAEKIVSGTIGVARGGTGVGTLTGIIKGNGTSAFSAATASDVVTLLGSTAVNRATADASGNSIADTYAKKTDIAGIYKYKGSVATESDLPASPATGDVYNIESASSYGAAGANVAWNGTAWDSLGEIFTIASITNAEIDAIIAS